MPAPAWYGMLGVPYCIQFCIPQRKEICMFRSLSTVLLLLVVLSTAQAQ